MTTELFPGDDEIRTLLRTVDWSRTPLGPLASWPKTLVGYVNMILAMPSPAIVFWGPEQTQIYNIGYAAIMGPRHPKYFGAPYAECWPDTYPAIIPHMRHVLGGGVAVFDETLFTLTRYGFTEEAYFTFTFSPMCDDTGAIAGVFQPVVEVTSHVLAERRTALLRAVARRPAATSTAVAEALAAFATDAKDVPFVAIYAWDEAEKRLVRAGVSEALADRDVSGLDACAREAFEAGATRRLDDLEARLGFAPLTPWGDAARSALVVPLQRAVPNATRGVIVLGVSPRLHLDDAYTRFLEAAATAFAEARERAVLVEREREARREAELQKEHLARLFMQAPLPICVLRGPEHVVELANEQMLGSWRRAPGDVVDRPLFEAMPELVEQGFVEILGEVFRRGQRFVGKERIVEIRGPQDTVSRDGYFNFVYEPLRGVNGETEGILVVAVDVTDEVRARHQMAAMRDAAERESRSKDEFLAMLGHELRNPLSPLLTGIHIIRRRMPGSPVERQLEILERQANNLRRIVDDLLEVSRVTHGKIELRRERIDVGAAVERAIESARSLLEARRHDVSVQRPVRGAYVDADAVRLEQVIVNLLTNAAKYTEAGGHIDVRVRREGNVVELSVRDDGVGISDELRPRLFQLFQQGRRDASRTEGGLGIGLTVVRRMVELHGGTVEARSEGPGKGSEFIVRLPALGEHVAAAAPVARPPHAVRDLRSRRVLVVDDNADAAEALGLALEDMGHHVELAYDGPSAVARCEAWRPEVVFLDIGLPGMDGYDVARAISQRAAERPLLVALTGYGLDRDRSATKEAGFDKHLVKPADLDVVRAIVRDGAGDGR